MANYKDNDLSVSFFDLAKFFLNLLNDKLDFQSKQLLPHLKKNGVIELVKKYFNEVIVSNEYKNFVNHLDNKKYWKNFSIPVGTSDGLWQFTIEMLVEKFLVEYLWSEELKWNKETLDTYYDNLEKFLIDDKIRITVKTPVIGLSTTEFELKIDDDISLIRLDKKRKMEYQGGTDFIKYVVSAHDLQLELFTEKRFHPVSEEELKKQSIVTNCRMTIQNLIMTFRLHHAGNIGVIDSDQTQSILPSAASWQNPRCGLPKSAWDSWHLTPYDITKNNIASIMELRKEIQQVFSINKNEEIARSIDRFMTSYEQDLIEERILHLIVSLESLLQDEVDELRYRLSIRAAKFIGNDPVERNIIYKTILVGYNIRNKTVHGKDLPTIKIDDKEMDFVELANRIEEYVRRAIKLYVKKTNEGQSRKSIVKHLDENLFLE